MNADVYSKSVEQLMIDGELTVTCTQGRQFGGLRFKAYRTGTKSGEGDTPRDAIIDLYKKLR